MFSSYDDSRLQVAETGQPWLNNIGLFFSFLFLHITWILEVDVLGSTMLWMKQVHSIFLLYHPWIVAFIPRLPHGHKMAAIPPASRPHSRQAAVSGGGGQEEKKEEGVEGREEGGSGFHSYENLEGKSIETKSYSGCQGLGGRKHKMMIAKGTVSF